MILLALLGSITPALARPAAQGGPTLDPPAGLPGTRVLVHGLDPTVPWEGAHWDIGEDGGGHPLALRPAVEGRVAFEVPPDAAPREYHVLLESPRIQCIRAPCGIILTFTVTGT